MRYIVLYILVIGWLTQSECIAQKPAIDLLPSSHDQMHPEAVLDTSHTHDSLVMITPVSNVSYTLEEKREFTLQTSMKEKKRSGLDSILITRNRVRPKGDTRQVIHPLIFLRISPIRIYFHITALKI